MLCRGTATKQASARSPVVRSTASCVFPARVPEEIDGDADSDDGNAEGGDFSVSGDGVDHARRYNNYKKR